MPQKETPVKPNTRWGRLTVVKPLYKNLASHVIWEAKCDCGSTIHVWGYHLVKKQKTSCGCDRPRNVSVAKQTWPWPKEQCRPGREGLCQDLGLFVFRELRMEPHDVAKTFYYALEQANQHDMCRELQKKWGELTGEPLFGKKP